MGYKKSFRTTTFVKLLQELPLYDELSIVKNSSAFSGYARSYKVEMVDNKDPLVQLESSKLSIEDLFKCLLIEMYGFKYQTTLPAVLSKVKVNENIDYSPVYYNSATKTVMNHAFSLDKSFEEILYRIVELMKDQDG